MYAIRSYYVYYNDIDNIETNTSLIGRLYNYGTITLYSYGGNLHLSKVNNIAEVVKRIEDKKEAIKT